LAEQAKILVAEAEENNLDDNVCDERFARWHTCSLCEQDHHGVVSCALGWACWKTYVGLPEADWRRFAAMYGLAHGLSELKTRRGAEEALTIFEACLATVLRIEPDDKAQILRIRMCIANCYRNLHKYDDALNLERSNYADAKAFWGIEARDTLTAALNLAASLTMLRQYREAQTLLRKNVARARRVLGPHEETMLHMQLKYATALFLDRAASRVQLQESVKVLEEIEITSLRVLGASHFLSNQIKINLERARKKLARAEGISGSNLSR